MVQIQHTSDQGGAKGVYMVETMRDNEDCVG